MSNRHEFRADMIALATRLIPTIHDDYRANWDSDEPDDPGMLVTVGAECLSPDSCSLSFQTGDNSFMGGAYGYEYWGLGYLYRDTKPEDFADEVISSLEENEEFNFAEGDSNG